MWSLFKLYLLLAVVSLGAAAKKDKDCQGNPGQHNGNNDNEDKGCAQNNKNFKQRWIQATHSRGRVGEQQQELLVRGEDNDWFSVDYNVTLLRSGVVSLAAGNQWIQDIMCSSDGTNREKGRVELRFKKDNMELEDNVLDELFPSRTLLVVNSEAFGPCDLGLFNETESIFDRFKDGFLEIETVSRGASGEVIIVGRPASYFALFEEASFVYTRLKPDDARRNLYEHRDLASTTISASFDLSLLTISAEVTVSVTAGIDLVRLNWGFTSGLDMSILFSYSAGIAATGGLSFLQGKYGPTSKDWDFVSIPIAGLPPIPLLEYLGLPGPKTGLYIEFPFSAEIEEVELEAGLSASATYSSSTGTKGIIFNVFGPWTSLQISSQSVQDGSGEDDNGLTFDTSSLDDPITIKVKTFAGMKPGFYLYVTSAAKAFIAGEIGVRGEAMASIPVPYSPGSVTGTGPCDICHYVEISAKKVLALPEDLEWEVEISIDLWFFSVNYKNKGKIPGVLSGGGFEDPIGNVCAIGDEDKTCANVCCNAGEICSVNNNIGTCGGSPTIPPSPYPTYKPSTPVPTAPSSPEPSNAPSPSPSNPPTTLFSSNQPTTWPSNEPSLTPSNAPSLGPTNQPSNSPSTNAPSLSPSDAPSLRPSNDPTISPTNAPSFRPTIAPSLRPSNQPTILPTNVPSRRPSIAPSLRPSNQPTILPTNQPTTILPTNVPSRRPSMPSSQPTTSSPTG